MENEYAGSRVYLHLARDSDVGGQNHFLKV